MFRILESNESKIAVPIGILTVAAQFLVAQFLANSSIANTLVPGLALILGLAVGWVLGEAFIYSSGINKVILGVLSTLFGASVTSATRRRRSRRCWGSTPCACSRRRGRVDRMASADFLRARENVAR